AKPQLPDGRSHFFPSTTQTTSGSLVCPMLYGYTQWAGLFPLPQGGFSIRYSVEIYQVRELEPRSRPLMLCFPLFFRQLGSVGRPGSLRNAYGILSLLTYGRYGPAAPRAR